MKNRHCVDEMGWGDAPHLFLLLLLFVFLVVPLMSTEACWMKTKMKVKARDTNMKMQSGAGDGVGGSEEAFREYRALLAESEPWKEEVFMLEIVAALQVSSHSTLEFTPVFASG